MFIIKHYKVHTQNVENKIFGAAVAIYDICGVQTPHSTRMKYDGLTFESAAADCSTLCRCRHGKSIDHIMNINMIRHAFKRVQLLAPAATDARPQPAVGARWASSAAGSDQRKRPNVLFCGKDFKHWYVEDVYSCVGRCVHMWRIDFGGVRVVCV